MNTKQLSEKLYREILKGAFDCKIKLGANELDPWHVILSRIITGKYSDGWGYTVEEAEGLLKAVAEKLVMGIGKVEGTTLTWEMVKSVADKELGAG